MESFKIYDRFVLQKAIKGEDIPMGTVGVVLLMHSSEPQAYEVEFIDDCGHNMGSMPTYPLTPDFMGKL